MEQEKAALLQQYEATTDFFEKVKIGTKLSTTQNLRTTEQKWRESMYNIRGIVEDGFSGVSGAISGSIRGIIQGTQTMEQAFKNMGQNIMLGLIDSIVNRGLKSVQNALLDFLFGNSGGGSGPGMLSGMLSGLGSAVGSGLSSAGSYISSGVSAIGSFLGFLDTGMWNVPGTKATSAYTGGWKPKEYWNSIASAASGGSSAPGATGAAGVAVLHPGEMVVPPNLAEIIRRIVEINGGSNFAGLSSLLTEGGGRGGANSMGGSYGQMTSEQRSSLSSLGGFGFGFGAVTGPMGIASAALGMGMLGKTAMDAMISGILGFDAVRGMLGVDPAVGFVSPTEADYASIADTYGYGSRQEQEARTAAAIGQSVLGEERSNDAAAAAAAAAEAALFAAASAAAAAAAAPRRSIFSSPALMPDSSSRPGPPALAAEPYP